MEVLREERVPGTRFPSVSTHVTASSEEIDSSNPRTSSTVILLSEHHQLTNHLGQISSSIGGNHWIRMSSERKEKSPLRRERRRIDKAKARIEARLY